MTFTREQLALIQTALHEKVQSMREKIGGRAEDIRQMENLRNDIQSFLLRD